MVDVLGAALGEESESWEARADPGSTSRGLGTLSWCAEPSAPTADFTGKASGNALRFCPDAASCGCLSVLHLEMPLMLLVL